MPSVNKSDEEKEKGKVMVETKLPVHEHVAPLEIQVPHVDAESSKQGGAQGVHEMIATTVGTLTKNLKEQEQELGKKMGHKLDKGKLPQGDESRMDTMSSSADGNEAVGSSMNDNTVGQTHLPPTSKSVKGRRGGRRQASIRANNMETVLPKILPCNWEAMKNIGNTLMVGLWLGGMLTSFSSVDFQACHFEAAPAGQASEEHKSPLP
uniref:Uncharacterized protein n=1 Tax=Salix viminalis TaxID=40686 RepID=A0A6N2MM82_SALVM